MVRLSLAISWKTENVPEAFVKLDEGILRQDVESMSWLLLIAFGSEKFKKELASLQAEFQGTYTVWKLLWENKMIFHQTGGVASTTQH